MEIKPSMLIITTKWNDKDSFKLIPITNDCPYAEGIYDVLTGTLALISTRFKQSFHMVPRLNEDGEVCPNKKPRKGGKNYQEQRVALDTYDEYYVTKEEEIIKVITILAVNPEYDFIQFLEASKKEKKPSTEGTVVK